MSAELMIIAKKYTLSSKVSFQFHTMRITASGCIVSNVQDGIGRNTVFANENNNVSTIYAPGYGEHGTCGFEYDAANHLTHVWELAGESGTEDLYYTYDEHGLLTSAANCDGVKVTYEYYTTREPFRVKRVRMTGGDVCVYEQLFTVYLVQKRPEYTVKVYLSYAMTSFRTIQLAPAAGQSNCNGKCRYRHKNDAVYPCGR